jgi:hypothetical protein
MTHPTRFCLRFFLLLFSCCSVLDAEDVKLRGQAVHLMEGANAASLLAGYRDYEQVVTFTFHDPLNGQITTGTYSRISAGSEGRREEFNYASYHAVSAIAEDRQSSTRIYNEAPEIAELVDQLPIFLGRFDDQDVIRSIEDSNVGGRAAKCINFDTHLGVGVQANQMCVDADRGTLLRWRVGDELRENSDFFQISTLWEPRGTFGTSYAARFVSKSNSTSAALPFRSMSKHFRHPRENGGSGGNARITGGL